MKRAYPTSRKSKRATASSSLSLPATTNLRAKLPTTSSSSRRLRSCSRPCSKSSLYSCSPITLPCAAVAMSTSRAISRNLSPSSNRRWFRLKLSLCFVLERIPHLCCCFFSGRPARYRRKQDRKSTRLNSSHMSISYAVFCLKKKKKKKKKNKKKKKKKKKKTKKKNTKQK